MAWKIYPQVCKAIMVDLEQKNYLLAVGLDGSDSSWRAFEEAIQQAILKKGLLHIVSIEEPSDASYSASEVLAAANTSHEKLERVQMKAKERAAEQNVDTLTNIVQGNSAAAMVDYVKKNHINLLLVGDTGHSSIWGALIGTNVEKIVRNAPCSVLVVR